MRPDESRQSFWGELAGLLLHPMQVVILETLLWVDQPLSASELTKVYLEEHNLAEVGYHARRLASIGVLEVVGEHQVRGSLKKPYRLVSKPGRDGSKGM